MWLTALLVGLAVAEPEPCIDLSDFDERSPGTRSLSAECKVDSYFSHSFISIRTRMTDNPLGVLPHCAQLKYAKCILDPRSCTVDFTERYRQEFVDSGCMAAKDSIIRESKLSKCMMLGIKARLKRAYTVSLNQALHQMEGELHKFETVPESFELWRSEEEKLTIFNGFIAEEASKEIASAALSHLYVHLAKYATSARLDSPDDLPRAKQLFEDDVKRHTKYSEASDKAVRQIATTFRSEIEGMLAKNDPVRLPIDIWSSARKFLREATEAIAKNPENLQAGTVHCVTAEALRAIECSPVLFSTIGFAPPIVVESTTAAGYAPCGAYRLKKKIPEHPAIIRKSAELMLDHFQTRFIHLIVGTHRYYRQSFRDMIRKMIWQETDVPSFCNDVTKRATCWIFSRCVRKQAMALTRDMTISKSGAKMQVDLDLRSDSENTEHEAETVTREVG